MNGSVVIEGNARMAGMAGTAASVIAAPAFPNLRAVRGRVELKNLPK